MLAEVILEFYSVGLLPVYRASEAHPFVGLPRFQTSHGMSKNPPQPRPALRTDGLFFVLIAVPEMQYQNPGASNGVPGFFVPVYQASTLRPWRRMWTPGCQA